MAWIVKLWLKCYKNHTITYKWKAEAEVCHQVGEEGEEEVAARGGRQGERGNLSKQQRNIQSLSARNLAEDCKFKLP